VDIEFAPILELKFFWQYLPLSLKDAIEQQKVSMCNSWSQLNPPVQNPLNYVTIPITAAGGKTFQVSYAVRNGVQGKRVLILQVTS
jgi:hypothetical protein